MRLILTLALLGFLAACARPGSEVLTLVKPQASAKTVTILVATNRTPGKEIEGAFMSGRSERLRYAEVIVSIPPRHKPPQIEWPNGKPDPMNTFAVVGSRSLSRDEFVMLAQRNNREKPAGVFVHGYNYSYQEALFRLAQMSSDAALGGAPILFDWPSKASLAGYIADRDAAAFSRDDFVSVLNDLGKAGVRTDILAHSMGAWLAVETIRQLSLMKRADTLSQIDELVLAAPDIDIDLFGKQLAMTDRLRKPIVILAAKDDLALALSRRLAGSAATAGALDINDPRTQQLAARDNLMIVDISKLPSMNGSNHDRFAALAAVYPQLRNQGRGNPVAGTGAFVLNGVGAVVSAPFKLGGAALSQ